MPHRKNQQQTIALAHEQYLQLEKTKTKTQRHENNTVKMLTEHLAFANKKTNQVQMIEIWPNSRAASKSHG